MIEQFLQKKIADFLVEFVQFQKSKLFSMQGLRLTKSKIKPKLVEIMSQIMGLPLQLSEGMVDEIKLNMPWQKLFLMNNSSIKLEMEGFKIKTKLKNHFNFSYNSKSRQSLIKHLTSKLISSQQSTSPLVKKLKEYFMDTLQLSVKDIHLEIQVDLEHKIDLIFKFDSIIARQEHKTNTTKINVHKFSVSYKVGHSKPEPLLYPTNMVFTRQKNHRRTQITSQKSMKIQKIHLNINNHNFNDIRRFLCLVSWHNSFMHLPVTLWREKPLALIKTSPKRKFQYYATLVTQNIKDRNFRKSLQQRKLYNSLYTQILKGSKDIIKVKALNDLQDKMYVWRIIAYRNFCIEKLKEETKKKNEQIQKKIKLQQIPEKDVSIEQKMDILKAENKLNGFSWMKSWFRSESNEKQLIEELQQKLDKIEFIPTISTFSVTIKEIFVNIAIITFSSRQNFLSARALDITYNYERDDEKQIEIHQMVCGKFRIQYDEYLGHDKKYLYLLQTKREGQLRKNLEIEQSQEEFEEIENFIEFRSFPDYCLKMEPIKICINHQIIERLTVFDFQRVQSFSEASQMNIVKHMDPYSVLKQMNKSFSPRMHSKQIVDKINQMSKGKNIVPKNQKVKTVQTGIQIVIPQQMAKQLCPCNEIVFGIQTIEGKLIGSDQKILQLKQISFQCNFPNQNAHNYEAMLVLGQKHAETFVVLNPFSAKVQQTSSLKDEVQNFEFEIKGDLVFDFLSDEKIGKLIKMLYLLKPTSKQTRNMYRMKWRRKQSIGQQFMDACENLNEHIVKSANSTAEMKPKKYFPLHQKSKGYLLKTENIQLKFYEAVLNISPIIARIQDQNIEGFFIRSDLQKKLKFQIYQIKKFSDYVGRLSQRIKKIFPQSQTVIQKPHNQEQSTDLDSKQLMTISKINFQINAYYQKVCFLKVELNDIQIMKEQSKNSIELYFMTTFRNGQAKDSAFLPLIEKTKMIFWQRKFYNNFVRQLNIQALSIDFTPQIFKFITKVYRIYLESLENTIKIENHTLNSVKLNITGNRYLDVKPFQTQCLQTEKDCNMILFGNKIELNLRNQFEHHHLTENCCLIKAERKLKIHSLESNIKIVNLQDRTIWISIKQQSEQQESFQPQTNEIIDIKYLSIAKSFDIQRGQMSQRPRGSSIHPRAHQKEESGESINMPLKSKEQYSILVKSEDQFLEIIDQGVTFKKVKISQILNCREIIIGDEDEQYLVLRCTQTEEKEIVHFRIQILSPVYIVNKLPWKISYHIQKQSLDVQEIANTKGRVIKRKSFQAIPLQKINSLQHNKIRTILYRQIHDLHINLDQFSGLFKIKNITEEMQKIKGQAESYKQSTLVCLSDGKRNLQIILKLQISDETLKIKVYPEYVFVNLCQMDIFFKIKQIQYTYPEIKLKTIKDSKKGHNLTPNQQLIESFVKTYISLGNEKYKQKEILQQLFQDFEEKIQIFAGRINKNLKWYFIYESGTRMNSSNSNGYNSSGTGYGSGYGSGSDTKELMPHYNTSQFCNESFIQYGPNKSIIYYRNLQIQDYFNLVIFVPTIKIINKSNSIFLVKSKANKRLIKIEGQQMNFLTVNSQGFSVQALDQNQEVNFNQWFNIDIYSLGTVYYAKQLSSNGYESKEYTLRKKKLRKRPKVFYRIVLSQHQRGIQVLIQESQYPPISFINKTHLKLKIEEQNEAYEEQLGPNDMAQFASMKNPYIQPTFKLYYAEHYEYLFVESFHVDEFRTIPCSKSSKFIISVEEFKDQRIVVFGDEKLLQMSEIKSEFQIQRVQKLIINIDSLLISFMNQFFKEFSALRISSIEFQKEDKNQKKYFKFNIKDIEGYDYSGIQPNFTFLKLQEQKNDMFRTLTKQSSNHASKSIFNSDIVISYHKNAIIVEKCHMRLASLKIIFNSYLILESVKVYQNQILSLFNLLAMYSQTDSRKLSYPAFFRKQFIFESFVWEGTSLTLKCLHLNILCVFLDKTYYKWIIKFLQWIGDLKPINFSSHSIEYENYTIEKLIKKIDVKKKFGEFANVLFEYPLREIIDITSIFLGDNEKSSMQKARIMVKILKGFGKIIYNSGLVPVITKKPTINEEVPDHLTYRQQFEQTHSIRSTETVLDKIKFFQFAQWKYEQNFSFNKLNLTPINRLERYNSKNIIIEYDSNYARIKVALDSFYGNKIHRKIEFVQNLNLKIILGLTDQYTVLYFIDKDEWKVKKHEQMIDMHFLAPIPLKGHLGPMRILKITTTLSEDESSQNSNINKDQGLIKYDKSKLDIYKILDPWITPERVEEISKFIESNKLIAEF